MMISCFPTTSETTQEEFDFADFHTSKWCEDKQNYDVVTYPGSGGTPP